LRIAASVTKSSSHFSSMAMPLLHRDQEDWH
jgi:hypothetical protein